MPSVAVPLPPVKKEPYAGYIIAEEEAKSALRCLDALKLYARTAEMEGKTIIIGIDLSFIPPEQANAIQPVLNTVRDLSKLGIIVVRGKGEGLAANVKKVSSKEGVKLSKVIILANEATAFGDLFGNLRGSSAEEKLVIVGVSSKNITRNCYIRIFDMLNMAFKIAYNGPGAASSPFIDIYQDPNNRNIIHFVPRAEPVRDENLLPHIYGLQARAEK